MVHIPKEKRTKWDRKSKKHILVGFCDNIKGYRIYDPEKNQVSTSRDVIIQEKPKPQEAVTVSIDSTDSVGESVEESVVKFEPLNESSSSESDYLDVEDENRESEASGEEQDTLQTGTAPQSTEETPDVTHTGSTTPVEGARRPRKKPERYGFANMCATATEEDGLTHGEDISGPERHQWLQAMAEELQSFQDNQVWEVVDTPSNSSVVQCNRVFKKKV